MKARNLIITSTVALALAAACSATPTGDGDGLEPQEKEDKKETPEPELLEPTIGFGGAEGQTHPLFGVGSYTGVDLSDPCNSSPIWAVETAIALTTGTTVVHDGKLWEITGEGVDTNWTMEVCTPPGTGYCADEYLWKEVQDCPAQ